MMKSFILILSLFTFAAEAAEKSHAAKKIEEPSKPCMENSLNGEEKCTIQPTPSVPTLVLPKPEEPKKKRVLETPYKKSK